MIGEILARAARNAIRRMTLRRLDPDRPTRSDGQLSLKDIAILTRKLPHSNPSESVGKARTEQS
ncbi:hypothetical protein [Paramagnetospirillum magneticum]|uniref:hypothetical protein n=1 Tax=Paramagnetospirillum magneticum TaxID=84159 RepID=UPI0011D0BEE7|nr:hypothetical protein [Paramagnetospirillum magneticum]